jgi:hypothetical protein
MTIKSPTLWAVVGLALLAELAACSLAGQPAPQAPAGEAVSTSDGGDRGLPKKGGGTRTVKVIKDPKIGTEQTIAKYWDYDRDAPFQVEHYSAKSRAVDAKLGSHYNTHTTVVASVSLPGKLANGLRVLAAAKAATPTEDRLDTANPSDGAIDVGAISPLDAAGKLDPDGASAEGAGVDPDFPSPADAAAVMGAPHVVTLEADDPTTMGEADSLASVSDGQHPGRLDVAFNQDWQRFTFKGEAGSSVLEINPDGTFLVDGKGAASAKLAAKLLLGNPVMQQASPHCVAFLVARTARVGESPTRTPMCCNCDSGGPSFRLLGVGQDSRSRAYVVADAFFKAMLKRLP